MKKVCMSRIPGAAEGAMETYIKHCIILHTSMQMLLAMKYHHQNPNK